MIRTQASQPPDQNSTPPVNQQVELERFRAEKDRFFTSHLQSPLTPEQKQHFAGLRYFPDNPALRLTVTKVSIYSLQSKGCMTASQI